ncbi:hypothetical protein SLEP1_g24698 [Rubroshorea leprosula]|uniref:Uncharacterized protein n=1 Tax=Rubroshorea leprosula TaxID=152421 RepID=A0AAV5JMP8_9ROSI|nr:hypothetical protein SLEP1_g24698 [Rubroshorea leprosula]
MELAVDAPVVAGWENKTIGGRLSNLRKAPHTLAAEFRFRANLHHEVIDCATSIKGYKKLEEVVRQYHVPRIVLYELVLTQLTPNSIKFIIGFMLLEIPAKATMFRSLFLCLLSTTQTRWYYISRREKMAILTNMRNNVSRWKRQFNFVRDTRTERDNNGLAARLSEWRLGYTYMNYPTLTLDDLELKDRITNYVKEVGLVDLEALVTPEVLALRGFVDVANLFSEERCAHLTCSQPRRAALLRRYPHQQLLWVLESHTLKALAIFKPTVSSQWSRALSYSIALFESEQAARGQNHELADSCKRLAFDKVSLDDEVNRLQSSEMANKAASAESRANELANKVNQLQEELDRVKAEKESGIQAAMDEVVRAVDRTKKAEAERDNALNDLNTLRRQVAVADQDLARIEEGLRKAKTQHQRCISIVQAQGTEWLMGADMFKDVVAVASMNTTTEIYNDVRGKVLKHRPDFPINELAFFEGEKFDEEGKILASPTDTTVRLRWELNEEGVPIWPPSVLKEGEEFKNLPRFNSWVGDAPVEEAEPSSTPPVPQFAPAATISSLARVDTSIPVDLTDD